MRKEGYIKLYHSFLEWEWYEDLTVQAVFLHLLLTVNHRDIKSQGTIFKQGSRRVSNKDIAEETGLSVQNVKTAIKKLESSGHLRKELVKGTNVITVTGAAQARTGSYVKLYRKFTSWQWYKHSKEKSIYIYSLLHARRFAVEDGDLLLEVGSYAKSFPEIGKSLGLSEQNVKTAFKNLKLTDDLRTVANRRRRVVSVCKYVRYHKYEEDTNQKVTDSFDSNLENIKNSNCQPNCENEVVTYDGEVSYNAEGLPGNQLINQRLTTDQPQPNQLYNKRDKRDKSGRVQDKTRQSSAPAQESRRVSTSIYEAEMDELRREAGMLTSQDEATILQEIYRQIPQKSIELFNKTVKEIYNLSNHAETVQIRDEVVSFQVEAYLNSIEISSEEDKVSAVIKWSVYRYKKHIDINIIQDVIAHLIQDIFSVTIPMDKGIRIRLLRCLETLSKKGIMGSELYSFLEWCRTCAFVDKPPGMDVVQAYLFNSRELPKLIERYFQ